LETLFNLLFTSLGISPCLRDSVVNQGCPHSGDAKLNGSMPASRRKFLSRMALGAAGLAVAGAVDGFGYEPHHPVARRVDIRLRRLPEAFDGYRIVQISDVHFGPYMGREGVERALKIAGEFQPDLLVFTGDFVSRNPWERNGPAGARHAFPFAEAASAWKQTPILAVLGNHDHWNGADIVAQALAERGITLLRNSSLALERERSRLWIAGVDDAWMRAADLERALGGIPTEEATILLAHEPDYADHAARYPIDLQLSGHSHGGQVRLPGIGAIILPTMAVKYPIGLNRVREMQVYTNCGLGVINPPVRFNCPPEVTFLTLQKFTPTLGQ
jgi:hypothetical protein